MNFATRSRAVIGTALALALGGFALTPAFAADGPAITWNSVPNTITNGATYAYGAVPAADTCTALDSSVDPAVAVDCVVSGYDTTVGTHTLTATATDSLSVTATATVSYTVTPWTLNGFLRPVKAGVNKIKAGQTVPLKFRIYTDAAKTTQVTDKTQVGLTTQLVSCTDFTALADPVALSSTKKGFQLKYTDGKFQQNWKTPKASWVTKTITKTVQHGKKTVTIVKKVKVKVSGCYVVTATAADGSSISAKFRLK